VLLVVTVVLVPEEQFCGGKITKSQGEIATPNWPEKKYPPGITCSWLITVDPGMVTRAHLHCFPSSRR